jgi:hypothetical protein
MGYYYKFFDRPIRDLLQQRIQIIPKPKVFGDCSNLVPVGIIINKGRAIEVRFQVVPDKASQSGTMNKYQANFIFHKNICLTKINHQNRKI